MDIEKERLKQFPPYLIEDIEKMDEIRKELYENPGKFTLIHLKVQFDYLVNSLKCAVIEKSISRTEAEEIREEYSRY